MFVKECEPAKASQLKEDITRCHRTSSKSAMPILDPAPSFIMG